MTLNPLDIDIRFIKNLLSDQYVFLTRIAPHVEMMCQRMGFKVEAAALNEFTRFGTLRVKTEAGIIVVRHEPGGFFIRNGKEYKKLGLRVLTAVVAAAVRTGKYSKRDFFPPTINPNTGVTHCVIAASTSLWQRAIQSGIPTELKTGVKVDGNAMDRATLKLSAMKLTNLLFLKNRLEKNYVVPPVPDDANELQVARAIVATFVNDKPGFLKFVERNSLIKLELDFERWQQLEMNNFKKRLE